jgi:hypothetical protein
MFLTWLTPIFQRGYDHTLQEDDLFAIVPERKTELQGPRLERYWKEEQDRVKRRGKGETPSLMRALIWFVLPTYWPGMVCLLVIGTWHWIEAMQCMNDLYLLWVHGSPINSSSFVGRVD